ncbi:hypothetical protein C0J50_0549 [Silurus asotus]|uniref:Uncharacterized protein n=1 Tax=Silurus asotus TaxID=30991 RepID=A0AAD5A8Z9_SILAS|nr:hypothetical protein C0J50_0549 [Silurus asotus]
MRYTFKPDDCMVITIPLGSIKNAGEGQLMPDKFTCRFKDSYKVFQQGRPKALGVAQIITALFIMCLGGILYNWDYHRSHPFYIYPSILMKASFIFNIIGICLAVLTITFSLLINTIHFSYERNRVPGLNLFVVIMVLYAFEFLLSAILIHWESKAVCRAHFNSLPMITLKQDL